MVIISRILLTALGLLLVANTVPGIHVEGIYIAIVVAVMLGILNVIVRPVLIILTLPITIVTLGLFIFIINALLFIFVASFIKGFEVDGFLSALLGSLIVSVISSIGNRWIK